MSASTPSSRTTQRRALWSGRRPRERTTRHDERRDRTHKQLFKEALKEFRRAGYERASIARIARQAGVSRPTFYFHFATKEEVLLELQWQLELQIIEHFTASENLEQVLLALVEGLIAAESSLKSPTLFRDMLRIYTRNPETQPLEEQPFPLFFELARAFARGASLGELREALDPAQACHLCLSSVFGYLIATPGPSEERRDDLQALVSLYLA